MGVNERKQGGGEGLDTSDTCILLDGENQKNLDFELDFGVAPKVQEFEKTTESMTDSDTIVSEMHVESSIGLSDSDENDPYSFDQSIFGHGLDLDAIPITSNQKNTLGLAGHNNLASCHMPKVAPILTHSSMDHGNGMHDMQKPKNPDSDIEILTSLQQNDVFSFN